MKISEPLLLVPNAVDGVDVAIDVHGGGIMGQAEAVRTALARGILKWHNDPQIKDAISRTTVRCSSMIHGRKNRRSRTDAAPGRSSKSLIVKSA